jgi:Na+/melibiose symporter-like transporter
MKRSILVAYGSPAIAMAILLLPPYVFIPAFYTKDLGLPLAWVGYIIVMSRVFDAIIDPLIGHFSDRTTSRFGRRKPWILAGTPLAIISVIALFAPPASPSLFWFASALFGLTLSWTMIVLPYNAWGAELSSDYHERTTIAGIREGMGLFGTLLAAATPTVMTAMGHAESRTHMMVLAALIVALLVPTMAWSLARVPDTQPARREHVEWRAGLGALLANVPFRRLILAYVLNAFANGLPATLFILFVSHVIGDANAYGPLLLAYFLSGLVAIPVWSLLSKRIGKHRTWVISMVLACTAFAFTPFVVGQGDIVPFLVICVVSGFGVGADLVLPAAIQADVVDADIAATGQQRTGLFFALWALATKLSLALSALALPVLSYWNFDATALSPSGESLNAPDALLALTLLYAAVPIVVKFAAIGLMWNFPLDAVSLQSIRGKISAAA